MPHPDKVHSSHGFLSGLTEEEDEEEEEEEEENSLEFRDEFVL